jgi:uncharacterized repeat protein (TIGR01451 family)
MILLGICGVPGTTPGGEFEATKNYAVGTGPVAVGVGDFNGDGKADLVVANVGSANVSVLLGNGDGTFQSAVNFGTGLTAPGAGLSTMYSIFVGDFNGDGKLDVAVFQAGNASGGSTGGSVGAVSVLLGIGDGTFQAAKTTAFSTQATSMVTADFNGDKNADLVVLENDPVSRNGSVKMYIGKGDGTFQPGQFISSLLTPAGGLLASDLNNDGNLDLAVGSGATINILVGKGDGTFQQPITVNGTAEYSVGTILATDLRLNGKKDLIVKATKLTTKPGCTEICIPTTDDHLSVFLGNGDGTFGAEQVVADEVGLQAFTLGRILTGKFNGDGKADVANAKVGNPSGTVEVRLGRGDGTFSSADAEETNGVHVVIAADLNGDSLDDLVGIGQSNDIGVLINTSPTSGADLGLVQVRAAPEPVGVGQDLTYSATVLNEGPEDSTGVTFSDTLPSGVTLVSTASSVGTCAAAKQVVTCSVGVLADAAEAQVKIVVKPGVTGTISNAMTVAAAEADENGGNNSATLSSTVLAVYTLTVTKSGNGTGTVNGGVAGEINCGSVCTDKYLLGTPVVVNANADASSTFDSWGGACSGATPTCSLTMDQDKTVTATFTAAPDFQVSPSLKDLTLSRGGQATDALTFTAQGGFSATISLTCAVSGPSPMPTCGISPASVKPGSSATLTVNANSVTSNLAQVRLETRGRTLAICLPLVAFVTLFALAVDRQRRVRWAFCLLVLAASIAPAACGGGGQTKGPQTFTVTVTATSGSIQHSTTITVINN